MRYTEKLDQCLDAWHSSVVTSEAEAKWEYWESDSYPQKIEASGSSVPAVDHQLEGSELQLN